LITPLVTPVVVESLVWRFILGPAPLGAINAFLGLIGLTQFQHAWLAEPQFALFGPMFSGFPWVLPVAMLIYSAGLQAIPDSVKETGIERQTMWKMTKAWSQYWPQGALGLVDLDDQALWFQGKTAFY